MAIRHPKRKQRRSTLPSKKFDAGATRSHKKSLVEKFRKLAVTEREVAYLLILVKHRDFPFPEMKLRLLDLKTEFEDYLLRLKELIIRTKANAFWTDDKTAVQGELDRLRGVRHEEIRDRLAEIAFVPAKEIKEILNQEKLAKKLAAKAKQQEKFSVKRPRKKVKHRTSVKRDSVRRKKAAPAKPKRGKKPNRKD